MLSAVSFFACDIGDTKIINGGGKVTFASEQIVDVQINSGVSNICTTNENGEFSFTLSAKTITIIPQKAGYFFIPKSITIDGDTDQINFEAVKIKELNGTLKLKSVCIMPTSIASMGDNYLFKQNGEDCIKLSGLKINYLDNTNSILTDAVYLRKNKKNYIDVQDNISFNCGDKVNLSFLLNANFTSINREWTSTNSAFTYLNILTTPTNADLIDNQITYSLYGINSETKAFTYDISFIFDYFEF